MNWEVIKQMIETVGVPVAMLMFFVWLEIRRRRSDEERERKDSEDFSNLVNRLSSLEDLYRDKLEKIVVENAIAFQNSVEAIKIISHIAEEQTQAYKQITVALQTRPCLKDTVELVRESQ